MSELQYEFDPYALNMYQQAKSKVFKRYRITHTHTDRQTDIQPQKLLSLPHSGGAAPGTARQVK